MATAAQILANQANAQHSTGPRTEEGKASSSQNARTHGLLSQSLIILPGQESDFEALSTGLTEELEPFGAFENLLFNNILHAAWNQHRCRLAERQLYLQAAKPDLDPILNEEIRQQLKLVQTYGSRAERSFKSAVAELRRVQTEMQYRIESGITEPTSPLVELKEILPQRITERLRHNQANLAAVRAYCEAPPDSGLQVRPSEYVPGSAAVRTAPAATPTPAPQPQPKVEPTQPQPEPVAKPKDQVRGGFARSTIFRRNKNKNKH